MIEMLKNFIDFIDSTSSNFSLINPFPKFFSSIIFLLILGDSNSYG